MRQPAASYPTISSFLGLQLIRGTRHLHLSRQPQRKSRGVIGLRRLSRECSPVAARGERVNGWADGLETLRNRSSMRKLLYDNLRCTVRPGLGLLEQLAEGVLSCPKSDKTSILGSPPSRPSDIENHQK